VAVIRRLRRVRVTPCASHHYDDGGGGGGGSDPDQPIDERATASFLYLIRPPQLRTTARNTIKDHGIEQKTRKIA